MAKSECGCRADHLEAVLDDSKCKYAAGVEIIAKLIGLLEQIRFYADTEHKEAIAEAKTYLGRAIPPIGGGRS